MADRPLRQRLSALAAPLRAEGREGRRPRLLAVAALAAAAAALCWAAGRRGFFPFDQSIVFHGGQRVAAGDALYRDVVAPAGPLLFWIQGLVFELFGLSYRVYLATAAAMNAAATVAAYAVVRRLLPGRVVLALAAAATTAVLFYPVFGTPWFENTGYLFVLLSLLAALPAAAPRVSAAPDSAARLAGPALAGLLAVAAFLCKQNVGLLAVPLAPAVLVFRRWGAGGQGRATARELAAWGTGLLVASAAVTVWVAAGTEPGLFREFFWELPRSEGQARMAGEGLGRLLIGAVFPAVPHGNDLLGSVSTLALLGAGWTTAVGLRRRGAREGRRLAAAGGAAVYLLVLQNCVMLTTHNEPENAIGLLGIAFAVAVAGLGEDLADGEGASRWRRAGRGLLAVGWLALTVSVAHSVWSREAHDPVEGVSLGEPCDVRLLSAVRWPEPLEYGGERLTCGTLRRVTAALEGREGAVAVVGDLTLLPAMAGRPAAGFLLWYDRGLTYAAGGAGTADRRLLAAVRDPATTTVVVETAVYYGEEEGVRLADDFPRTAAYVEETYAPPERIGRFLLHRRR